MEQTDNGQSEEWWEEGEWTSQRTCMNDQGTWTMVWGLTVGPWGGLGRGGQRGRNWDNCTRITIKRKEKKGKVPVLLSGNFVHQNTGRSEYRSVSPLVRTSLTST